LGVDRRLQMGVVAMGRMPIKGVAMGRGSQVVIRDNKERGKMR